MAPSPGSFCGPLRQDRGGRTTSREDRENTFDKIAPANMTRLIVGLGQETGSFGKTCFTTLFGKKKVRAPSSCERGVRKKFGPAAHKKFEFEKVQKGGSRKVPSYWKVPKGNSEEVWLPEKFQNQVPQMFDFQKSSRGKFGKSLVSRKLVPTSLQKPWF